MITLDFLGHLAMAAVFGTAAIAKILSR